MAAENTDTALIKIWNETVGAVLWDQLRGFATFEYDPGFPKKGLDLSPRMMPLQEALAGNTIFEFRTLSRETFMGLPGLLADSLPDKFGNKVIDAWLARRGRSAEDFSPVERLCYTGIRGMGALEFEPAVDTEIEKSVPVEVSELVELAGKILHERSSLQVSLGEGEAILDIFRVGTSAGGARPKAVIALNDSTGEIRSGQVEAPGGFDYWILKFDGVKDESLGDPEGYGRIEYAYHQMALLAEINMTECRILEENGRAHFMTRRFDRTPDGGKLHFQSLCGIAHFDYNAAGQYGYEQAFQVMRQLRLSYQDTEQLFRRMVFNILSRNQDDHTKNIAFIMDKEGLWSLSPAFDVIYAHNPSGPWTNLHQMSVNGKRTDFIKDDVLTVAGEAGVKKPEEIIRQVVEAVGEWPELAKKAGVPVKRIKDIRSQHRGL
jgi:serine/threonine-protein kinase HipA